VIFISYARDDAGRSGFPEELGDELMRELGQDEVFYDRRSLVAGQKWDESIEAALRRSSIYVLVTGDRLLEVTVPRLVDAESVLGREYAIASEIACAIVPVVVGAPAPDRSVLPAHLRGLSSLHWIEVAADFRSGDVRDVSEQILRTVTERLISDMQQVPDDPVVACINQVMSLSNRRRDLLRQRLASEPSSAATALLLAIVTATLVDRAVPVTTPRGTSPVLEALVHLRNDLSKDDRSERSLTSARQRLRDARSAIDDRHELDRHLLAVADVVLSRSLEEVHSFGAGSASMMGELAKATRRLSRADGDRLRLAREYVADHVLFLEQDRLREDVVEVRDWDGPRRSRPRSTSAVGRVKVRSGVPQRRRKR
jgi:hypothetical protein